MKKLWGILIAIWLILASGLAVWATAQPDSAPTITNVRVNRNLYQTGDALIYGEYDIPYVPPYASPTPTATPLPTPTPTQPSEPVDDNFLIRIFKGADEIGSVTPYADAALNNGYNHGVFGVYFVDEVTWGASYSIKISENPLHFDTPTSWTFAVSADAFTSLTEKTDNQLELADYILHMADRLETYYPTLTFSEPSPDGTVLSSPVGENYFQGAIQYIRYLAPTLFYVQAISGDEFPSKTWTTTQFDEYEQRFHDTWVGDEMEQTAEQFGGTAGATMAMVFAVPVMIGMVIFSSITYKKVEPGFITASLVMILCGMLGWFPVAIMASLLQLSAIYLAYVFFYSRG